MEEAVGEVGLIFHESLMDSVGNGHPPNYFWSKLNLLVMLGAISWGTFLGYLFVGLLVYYGYVCWKYGLLREWLTGKKGPAKSDHDDPGGRQGTGGDSPSVGPTRETLGPAASGPAVSGPAADSLVATGPIVGARQSGTSTASVAVDSTRGSGGTPVYPIGKQIPLGLVEFADAEAAAAAGQKRAGPGVINDTDAELFKIAEVLIGQLQSLIQEAAATQIARPEWEGRTSTLLKANRGLIGTTCQASIESFLERSSRMQLRYVLTQADIQRLWGIGVELPDGLVTKAGTSAGARAAEDERIRSTLKQRI